MENVETTLARHDERISDLEEWKNNQQKILHDIQTQLREIREDYASRPTWAVTIVLTLLSTLVGTMAIFIVTNL